MNTQIKKWEILDKSRTSSKSRRSKLGIDKIINILLENRGIKTAGEKREFFRPRHPEKLTLAELGIEKSAVAKTVSRIKKALKSKEKVVVYGDYDADGICGTAILWECLYSLGLEVLPYIPDRFSEGYGIKAESVNNLKLKTCLPTGKIRNLKLIITVDNGIVANNEIEKIKRWGIDVIVCDHHILGKRVPGAFSIIHTEKICGAAIAWILAREITSAFRIPHSVFHIPASLDLAGIGTIADQMPLVGLNRSFAKYGVEALRGTARPGLLSMYREAGIEKDKIGTYEINYLIAPRINAMGRLQHSIESLRLLCTKNRERAHSLALHLGKVNQERQRIVDEVVSHARRAVDKLEKQKAIVLAHKSYHEGVIGLAASKLVEEFYKPAIVICRKRGVSKASARSVPGFDIIKAVRELDDLIEEGGGHPMAAGFSIKTDKIQTFSRRFNKIVGKALIGELLLPKLRIDTEISFEPLNENLVEALKIFEPAGIGNPKPSFATRRVEVLESNAVGSDKKHLKLVLRNDGKVFDGIAFGFGNVLPQTKEKGAMDIVYSVEENVWNGNKNLQLKIKDISFNNYDHQKR